MSKPEHQEKIWESIKILALAIIEAEAGQIYPDTINQLVKLAKEDYSTTYEREEMN